MACRQLSDIAAIVDVRMDIFKNNTLYWPALVDDYVIRELILRRCQNAQ